MSFVLRAAAAGVLLASTLGACGQRSCSFPPVSASPVDGLIIAVDAIGLTDVRGFTLRQADGSTVGFQVGQLDNPTEFPPGHLKEHQASASPIRVWFRVDQGRNLIAYHLEDAEGVPATEEPVSSACGGGS